LCKRFDLKKVLKSGLKGLKKKKREKKNSNPLPFSLLSGCGPPSPLSFFPAAH
jgi:hypothetical protein